MCPLQGCVQDRHYAQSQKMRQINEIRTFNLFHKTHKFMILNLCPDVCIIQVTFTTVGKGSYPQIIYYKFQNFGSASMVLDELLRWDLVCRLAIIRLLVD